MQNNNVIIRAATPDDIVFFFDSVPVTLRAWVAEYKGERVAIAGIARLSDLCALAFSNVKENDAPDITVYRAAKALFEKIKSVGVPVVAHTADDTSENINNAPKFLESLGFRNIDGVYIWN